MNAPAKAAAARFLRDELTRNRVLEVEFYATSGKRETLRIPASKASEKLVMAELEAQGALLPPGTTGRSLLQLARRKPELTLTERTGFREVSAFVLPERMLGAARGKYRWNATADDPRVGLPGRQRGTLAE